MAPESHGRANLQGLYGLGSPAGQAEPPPSTLAAQLVENIAHPARSSRPDEISELKRLSEIIEQVKDNVRPLKTDEERLEHNHLLIYVCGGVVLESLQWQEPFGNHVQMRTEATKALRFLSITIRETPAVLACTSDGKEFLSRGQAPLWLWILPKVLKMLGHRRCLAISPAIEALLLEIVLLTAQTSGLWEIGASLMRYFQATLNTVLPYLKAAGSAPGDAVDIELPPKAFWVTMPNAAPQRCSYTLKEPDHAVRLATGVFTVMKDAILSSARAQPYSSSLFDHYSVWLWDTLQPLVRLQASWPPPVEVGLASTLQTALDLAAAQRSSRGLDFVVSQKAKMGLAGVCSEMIEQPQRLISDDGDGPSLRRVLCLALVHLAKETIVNRPLSILIASRLIPRATQLTGENSIVGEATDLGVCFRVVCCAAMLT